MKTSSSVLLILQIALVGLIISANAQTENWVTKTSMPTARSDVSAVTIGDMIIVAGGCTHQICPNDSEYCYCTNVTNAVEAYLPLTNQWKILAPLPAARCRHAATVINNKMYLIGGRDVNDALYKTIDVYNPTDNTWITLEQLWGNPSSDLVAISVTSNIYAVSGYDENYSALNRTCSFNVLIPTDGWDCTRIAPMNIARGDACGATLDSKFYVFGGFPSDFCTAMNTLEVFDPIQNSWTIMPALHSPRADSACAFLHGEFHAIGGEQKDKVVDCSKFDIPIPDVEHFDPVTNTWKEENVLPEARFRFAGATYGDSIYIFGGQSYINNITFIQPVLNEVLEWDDTTIESTSNSIMIQSNFMIITFMFMMLVVFSVFF